MAGPIREQALPLLASANNHGDLSVKLSSLKQLKDVLLSAEPSQVAELLSYLIDLQSSPESLLRKGLIEVIEAVGMKAKEHLLVLMPVLFACLKDMNSMVAKQSVISGMKIFCGVLEELSSQFHRHGIVERWLEELWNWMVKFKDTVFGIILRQSLLVQNCWRRSSLKHIFYFSHQVIQKNLERKLNMDGLLIFHG